MKVVVLGASGWIGSHIVAQAKSRGHEVTALVRNSDKYDTTGVTVKSFDLNNHDQDLSSIISDETIFVAAIGGRALGNHEIVANTASTLLAQLPNTSIERLVWVGGAGSLEVAPNLKLIDTPEFPAEYKDEAIAQSQALTVFKSTQSPLNWTYISPAAEIFPGDKMQAYRVGFEQLLLDDEGNSRISVADYATALVDEIEKGEHINKRIGIAY
ncbi:NAD(P)-dependent oxidoreductase [Pseudoalteromonas luteoviolacea]|uniref:NAD(P)-dependent oxidoreductase n=1 Tax=Pseudoalteromonas luteoviolacea TaxID=43657 RepID=UPI001B3583C0|nr:NAD(P)-dependent oxidoreductase [Pseudoalteromonas luteoviolacea]MBQ4810922.1 NAD(P)-dependent oxidoreductase [Pseudoalteromonas luteoviolacea]